MADLAQECAPVVRPVLLWLVPRSGSSAGHPAAVQVRREQCLGPQWGHLSSGRRSIGSHCAITILSAHAVQCGVRLHASVPSRCAALPAVLAVCSVARGRSLFRRLRFESVTKSVYRIVDELTWRGTPAFEPHPAGHCSAVCAAARPCVSVCARVCV